MKLYGDLGSSNTCRVLAAAAAMDVPLEFVFLDLFSGQNRTPAYLALNPNGTIPTLVDGKAVLFEASAIMLYLAEQCASPLLPSGMARYDTLKWMFWAAEHFRRGPSLLIEERFIKRLKGQPEDPALVAEALHAVHRYCAVLDHQLSTHTFVTGERLTLADFDLVAPLSHLPRNRAPFLQYPHIARWYQQMHQVPAWHRSWQAQQARIVEIERQF